MLERSALIPVTTSGSATTNAGAADAAADSTEGPAVPDSHQPAPRLADGVVLLGEYQDSGFTEPHYLIIRGDGQVLHVSKLLHVVASAMETLREEGDGAPAADADLAPAGAGGTGAADLATLAEAVSTEYGRTLTTEGLTFLLEERLRPMGLIAAPSAPAEGDASDLSGEVAAPAVTDVPAPTANPLLALRLRRTLVSPTLTRRVARVLAPLFNPLIVVVALGTLIAGDVWLLRTATLSTATSAALDMPVLLLGLLGVLLVSTLFHEFGHAAACHRGGATPGAIGVALYTVYPAFYTDVTTSYQLNRRGRLRTDLGGVYFNALTLLVMTGIYLGTHYPPLLLAIAVVHIEMLQQLMPIARLDGYFVVADLVGVPDLFGRVRPIVTSLVPWRPTSPRVSELRLRARVVVTLWVFTAVPALIFALVMLVLKAPSMAVSIWEAEQQQWQALVAAAAAVDPAAAAMAGLSMFLLPLPLVGLALLIGGLASRLAARASARLSGHTARGSHRADHRSQEVTMSGSKPAPVLPMMEPTNPTNTTSPPGAPPTAVPPMSSPREATGIAAREAIVSRTAADFTEEAMLRPTSRPPARGWRRGVYAATRGGVNLGPGGAELREIDLLGRVRTPVRGCRRIVVISRKGGAGKTTTTLMLGHTLATHRGDRVVALDANPDAGSLAHRMRRETAATVTNLLEEREFIQRYADMRGFTSQSPDTRLEVVASDDDPRITQALGEDDYRRAIGVLDRHYNLVLVDTGTGILDSAIQGILTEADQVVVVMPPALDGARVAAMTLDWLEEHHHADLVRGAVAVVNAVHGAGQLEIARIEDHFAARCRAVIRIPWDPVLQAGAHTSLNDLSQASRDAYLELAAAVADSFGQDARSERAPWGGAR